MLVGNVGSVRNIVALNLLDAILFEVEEDSPLAAATVYASLDTTIEDADVEERDLPEQQQFGS